MQGVMTSHSCQRFSKLGLELDQVTHGNDLYKSTRMHELQKLMHGSVQDDSARGVAQVPSRRPSDFEAQVGYASSLVE
jgi:hypothetical protein